MAADRFIYFRGGSDALGGGTAPTVDELVKIVKNYVGEAGEVKLDTSRNLPWICCALQGKPTHPLKGLEEVEPPRDDERWFEVYVQDQMPTGDGYWRCKTIDVLTRMQDHYTNVLADGLVDLLVRYYRAKLES